MDKAAVINILMKFKDALERQEIHIKKLILYGSYAKELYHAGSDIDVVVISDDFIEKGYWTRIDILSEAIFTVMAPIEAIAMTEAEWTSKEYAAADYAADGEVVFAA